MQSNNRIILDDTGISGSGLAITGIGIGVAVECC